ncbi:MAG: hypothetical protein MRY78_07335 [Saprospiraceae bacterium]|nr:hypothetical protein [Saprospiraceae bacterium]
MKKNKQNSSTSIKQLEKLTKPLTDDQLLLIKGGNGNGDESDENNDINEDQDW